MKRIFAATAIALTATTGMVSAQAVDAPTEAQINLIESYAPGADVSLLSDAQVNAIISVLYAGGTESDKRGYVQGIFENIDDMDGTTVMMQSSTLNEADILLIESYAPGADVTMLTETEVASLVGFLNSGRSEDDKRGYVQALFEEKAATAGDAMTDAPAMLSEAEMNLIQSYAADADVSTLTETQAASLIGYLNSGRSEADKRAYVRTMFQ